MKATALALMALMVGCSPAMAQQQPTCWDREFFIENVIKPHEGKNVGYGLNHVGYMVEVWVRPDNEWLLTTVAPDMTTCLASYGVGWQEGYKIKQGVPG